MKRVNTQGIGAILDDFLTENPDLADRLAETRAMNAWNSMMGGIFARYTKSLFIKNRTLYIKITSPVVKSELIFLREQLVARLNEQAGSNVLNDIVVR
jgi:hypothetical protein